MSKTLRVAFVMGGGVSLGTFSGAALTESLKQLIVYGQYDSGYKDQGGKIVFKTYEKVEIDVFSGSSAGAVSLGIMLRILTNHKDKFKFLGFPNYKEMRSHIEKLLLGQFGEPVHKMKNENPTKYESLIAVQVVQLFQEKIWVKEVDLNKLLGTENSPKDQSHQSGILDRTIVDNLARSIFHFDGMTNRLNNKVLLADRVLFACTLSNLNFIVKCRKKEKDDKNEPFLNALNDTAIDRNHRELRVFDLNFGEINPATIPYYPINWIQYHIGDEMQVTQSDGEKSYPKTIRNLELNDVWREIAATTIASAAFPFAFEPVVLNRYRYELGENWPAELKNKEKYPFTYVDGGMFNNEPLKEGLRMVSYLDTINSHIDFERVVIFIDPIVGDVENQFKVNLHDELGLSRSLLSGKAKVGQKSTFVRLVDKLPYIISAILNEAQGFEISNISSIRERFQHRKHIRDFYKNSVLTASDDKTIISLRNYIIVELDKVRKKLNLPPNVLQIQHELLRIMQEERDFFKDVFPLDNRIELIDKIQQFVYTPVPKELPNLNHWMFALSCISLDIAMKLVGKTDEIKIVPIAPFDFYNQNESSALVKLPGTGIAGFAGFASEAAGFYEVNYGKYCAFKILGDLNLTSESAADMEIPKSFDYNTFNNELKGRISKSMLKRVKEIIPTEYSTVLPFLEGYIGSQIFKFVNKNIDNHSKKQTFEFRIQVTNDVVILRGYSEDGNLLKKNNIEPVKLLSGIYLVAQLTYDFLTKKWSGDYVSSDQKLFIDKMRIFDNSPSVSIELPNFEENDALFMANPIFYIDARGHLGINTFTELKKANWKLQNDIKCLDEELWAKDSTFETFTKLGK